MPKLIIEGGKKLSGEVKVSGSKNAVLPILCATLLTNEKSILTNVPDIDDVQSMIEIISALGAKITFKNNTLEIDPSKITKNKLPHDLIKRMRASILIIGGLLPRFKEIKIPFPGGCVLGKRSVSTHTQGFKDLNCEIIDETEGIHIKCKKLVGNKIILNEMSVTATENVLMSAALAEGKTEIRMAAAEPHVQDLCHFLKKMGAKISGIGTNTIHVEGVKKLKGAKHKIIGDYLEAGTYAIAAVATRGNVKIKGIPTDHLDILWQKLSEIGAKFEVDKNSVHIKPSGKLTAVNIRTAVYPSFPTDLQAPFAVLMTRAKGVSRIFETLFEGRLNYLFELEQMGAHVEYLNPHQAIIIGPKKLKAIPISSCDIRAGAAMVVAALMTEGLTEITNIRYIDRGYENLDEKLRGLGAVIERVD